MGSTTTTELGLDLKPPFSMTTVSSFLREVLAIGDGEGRVVKLEECVRSLEEERRKIDAFKRELPLSMLILNDVIDELKEELMQRRSGDVNACPVLEEFMPIKGKYEEEGGVKMEKDYKDKMNWMSSAQLWSDNYSSSNNNTNNNNTNNKRNSKERDEEPHRRPESENPFAECKYKGGGGAFLPFKGLSGFPASARKEEKVAVPLPDLPLLSPGIKISHAIASVPEQQCSAGSSSKGGSGGSRALTPSSENAQLGLQAQQQQVPRKARRCWSPELHRRFVSALQQLGGSQVATPKQIRELMKVDGLTNDEVKSHLQKYRLHTRRLPAASASANQLVMLGGLWAPPDHHPVSKQCTSQSGSPQGPLQLAGSARGISVTGGDSCEEEDGKSESYSWKGNLQRSGEEETN